MSVRNSLGTSTVLTFALLLAGLWVVVVALDTIGAIQAALAAGATVGQTAFSGFVGLLVMAVFLVLAVFLYGELSETGTAPSTWPPE